MEVVLEDMKRRPDAARIPMKESRFCGGQHPATVLFLQNRCWSNALMGTIKKPPKIPAVRAPGENSRNGVQRQQETANW